MSWWTGKDKLVVLAFGDSNGGSFGTIENTAPNLQTYVPENKFWIRDGSLPYVQSGHAWRPLDHDSPSRLAESFSANGTGVAPGTLYVGQIAGGHGCPAMSLASTLYAGTGLPVYTWGGYMGGSTAEDWTGYLWSQLQASVTDAFAEIPGTPTTAADIIYISTGGGNLVLGTDYWRFFLLIIGGVDWHQPFVSPTAREFYANILVLRALLVDAGFWVPGTTQIIFGDIPRNGFAPVAAYPEWQGIEYVLARLPDRVALVSSDGATYEEVFAIHYSPQSYVAMGSEAGALALARIPLKPAAWWSGKSTFVAASIGDSNAFASGGLTPPGGQEWNHYLRCWASASGEVPYSESNAGWRDLDPNGTARQAEYESYIATVGNVGFIGQYLAGNGNAGMQMGSTIHEWSDAELVYLYQAAAGGTTADFWANGDGWDTLLRTIPDALAAIPATSFDVIFLSLGTNDVAQAVTAAQYVANIKTLRSKMVAAGWWVPGVTQVVMMDLPRGEYMSSVGYPETWRGLDYVLARLNDRINYVSSIIGMEYDPAAPVHYLPPSYTDLGRRAGEKVLAQIPKQQSCLTLGGLRLRLGGNKLRVHSL